MSTVVQAVRAAAARRLFNNRKQAAVSQFNQGEWGNKLRSWATLDALVESGYNGLVGIRYRQPDSPFMRYGVPAAAVTAVVQEFLEKGAIFELLYYCESAPDAELLVQGEVLRAPTDAYPDALYYALTFNTTPNLRMREALLNANGVEHATGAKAAAILRHYLSPASMAELQDLWDRFPDAVVEFSTYRRNLGSSDGCNTLWWEVRIH